MCFGESAAEALSRCRHLVIPGGTHIHRSACLNGLVEEFLLHADPDSVDAGCLEEDAPPPFYLGE